MTCLHELDEDGCITGAFWIKHFFVPCVSYRAYGPIHLSVSQGKDVTDMSS
jgi:hypothetical protein